MTIDEQILKHLDSYLANLDQLDDDTIALVYGAVQRQDWQRENGPLERVFDSITDNSAAEQSEMNRIAAASRKAAAKATRGW